jgi:hypothetical protein
VSVLAADALLARDEMAASLVSSVAQADSLAAGDMAADILIASDEPG